MFDLLPRSAVGGSVVLPQDVLHARVESRKLFKALPQSSLRESALRDLARLGSPGLKTRVVQRARIVSDAVPDRFPQLDAVVTEAVNCRNLFVHGTSAGFDYNGDFEPAIFLTQALEFVFAASELVEAGWDIAGFYRSSSDGVHPFAQFGVLYHFNLYELSRKGILRPE